MTTFYVVSWLVILGYWLLIAGVTFAHPDEAQSRTLCHGLATDYLHLAVGGHYCLSLVR